MNGAWIGMSRPSVTVIDDDTMSLHAINGSPHRGYRLGRRLWPR
jgi:hypothetical protein